MIDIHAHILPGIDDGAGSLEISLRMAEIARVSGTSGIIATPHHRNGRYETNAGDVRSRVEALNRKLRECRIGVKVYAGQEIRLTDNLIDELSKGGLLTLNDSRYLLVELPPDHIPAHWGGIIYELGLLGKVPVIAHPERNAEVMHAPDRLSRLVGQGALCQITAASLTGGFGAKASRTAWRLCKARLVHLVASDCHDGCRRVPGLDDAYGRLTAAFGREYAGYLQQNAWCVLEDRTIDAPPVLKLSWRRFFRRRM